jgi:hypothetical protein
VVAATDKPGPGGFPSDSLSSVIGKRSVSGLRIPEQSFLETGQLQLPKVIENIWKTLLLQLEQSH